MSNGPSASSSLENLSRDDLMSALFANMVVQQTNMALVFLGKVPHPETGKPVQDLEAAQLFIDQLEMLAVKTRGNLQKEEERLLQQSLMTLRMAFVEAVEKRPTAAQTQSGSDKAQPTEPAPTAPAGTPSGGEAQPIVSGEAASEESRKKFTKKY